MKTLFEHLAAALPFAVLAGLCLVLGDALADRLSLDYLFGAARDLGRDGGIGPVLANTIAIVGLGVALALPVALSGAMLHVLASDPETARVGPGWRAYRAIEELAVSMPRLLWGLGGAAVFGGVFGLGVSAATGVATLGCLVVPILFTGFAEGLGRAHRDLAPTLGALGVPPLTGMMRVTLRAARPSLGVALLLAIGRALGDAAALLLTAGISLELVRTPMEPASTLAVMIYVLAVDIGGCRDAALSAAAVLLVLTALLVLPVVWIRKES